MVVGPRALRYMSLGRLEKRKGPRSLRGQPGGGGSGGGGGGGGSGGVAHHQPSHSHVRAVRRQAERQKAQQGTEVHVSGAGQLGGRDGRAPGEEVRVSDGTQTFTQHLPLRRGGSRGRGVDDAEVWGRSTL